MAARICSRCDVPWPARKVFERCPECLEKTGVDPDALAIPTLDAARRKRNAEFERFYTRHETERILAKKPSPEEVGRLEALEIFALEQAYRLAQ